MKIGIIGLGKMGSGFALQAQEKKYQVFGYDKKFTINEPQFKTIKLVDSLHSLVEKVGKKGVYWLSILHGEPTKLVIEELLKLLEPEAIIIDSGNNLWKNTKQNWEMCKSKGVYLIDAGTSGGPNGARNGACFMVGGANEAIQRIEQLFIDLAQENGYLKVGNTGAGHFAKMVHNGIEYGMMQAIAEGFAILDKSEFEYDLSKIATLWNSGSVIRSWLIELTAKVLDPKNALEFTQTVGTVNATGEAKWTLKAALDLDVPAPVIALALMMRQQSMLTTPFANQLLAQLRKEFGGHQVTKK